MLCPPESFEVNRRRVKLRQIRRVGAVRLQRDFGYAQRVRYTHERLCHTHTVYTYIIYQGNEEPTHRHTHTHIVGASTTPLVFRHGYRISHQICEGV